MLQIIRGCARPSCMANTEAHSGVTLHMHMVHVKDTIQDVEIEMGRGGGGWVVVLLSTFYYM